MPGRRNTFVKIPNLIGAAASEKCYGVLPFSVIAQHVDPRSVTHKDHLRNRFDMFLIWLPKSQARNVELKPSDMFPNLRITYGTRAEPNLIPYKTEISLEIPQWLAIEKMLVETNEEGELEVVDQEPSYHNGW